jgi:hypothetical protein
MKSANPITIEYVQGFFDLAKAEFSFLTEQGFNLIEQKRAAGISFKDGFRFRYSRPSIDLILEYYDMELMPMFCRGKDKVNYYFIDRYLFSNASGYAGCMFPLNKLAEPIQKIARDIKENYNLILVGNDATWEKIMALANAPQKKHTLP